MICLIKNKKKKVAVKSLYDAFENDIENCHFRKLSENNTLSAVAYTCMLHLLLQRVEEGLYITWISFLPARKIWWSCRSYFTQRSSMVAAVEKTFSKCLTSHIISQFVFGKCRLEYKNLSFHKQTLQKKIDSYFHW